MTLNNDVALDHAALSAFRQFREEAWKKGFRYFLEVFPPNAPANPIEDVPRFVSDSIVRMLAGAGVATRPLFLKIPYFGPAAMEQLANYDSSLVVGILGGSAGTSFDAFQMLWEAKKYGAGPRCSVARSIWRSTNCRLSSSSERSLTARRRRPRR